jgi:hypothetical protein
MPTGSCLQTVQTVFLRLQGVDGADYALTERGGAQRATPYGRIIDFSLWVKR